MKHTLKTRIRSILQKNSCLFNIYKKLNTIKIALTRNIDDESYSKKRYYRETGLILNLDNPKTFNEKLTWLKLNNRDPLLTICSDKFKVRDYIKKIGLERILTKICGVYDSADDINFEEFKYDVFLKTNHGCGCNILYKKGSNFNKNKFIKDFNENLHQNYYYQSREWNYENIEPRIIAEEVLDSSEPLLDYKFMCFDGKVKMFFVNIEGADEKGSHNLEARRGAFDVDFNQLDISFGRKRKLNPNEVIEKPLNYEKMIEYAEIISKPFVFCRVDLYNIKGNIYFGETTFYTGGCVEILQPNKWEMLLGDWIDLKSEKIVNGK